jgi:type III restriction enzyme
MSPRKAIPSEQLGLLEARVKTAPCVTAIRKAVAEWRQNNYKGITDTTRLLLNYWFKTDHRLPNGRFFRYHDSQREAMETLIYVYEVARQRRHKSLLEKYAPNIVGLRLLQYDDFTRYCIKMATGSGKTKVMSLAVAWQYFNAVSEGLEDYAKVFLVIAPNVIVFERLRTDFSNGRIFQVDPVIPPELKVFWDFDCYMRDEGERSTLLNQHTAVLRALGQSSGKRVSRDDGGAGVKATSECNRGRGL